MFRRFTFVLLFFLMAFSAVGVFVLPTDVLAGEPACDCYCESSVGAKMLKNNMTQVACRDYCESKNVKAVSCAVGYDKHPISNPLCFTRKQCEAKKGDLKIFDSAVQPRECLPEQKYCYLDSAGAEKVKLQVAFGGLVEVANIGDYVNGVYKWLMVSAFTIAIVFIMIGGLQYVVAAGGGEVGAAKKRIVTALIGLVLLSSAHLILFTVNPQLVKLEVPKLPLFKRVDLFKQEYCGDLRKKGYDIAEAKIDAPAGNPIYGGEQDPKEACGAVSDVLAGPKKSSVPAGTICTWGDCGNYVDARCVGVDKKSRCLKCEDVVEKGPLGVTPSSSLCAGLSRKTNGEGKTAWYKTCGWTKDADLAPTALGGLAKFMDQGSCVMVSLNCPFIKKCEDYDKVVIQSEKKSLTLKEIPNSTDSIPDNIGCAGSCGDFSLESYCNENKCGVPGGCEMYRPEGILAKVFLNPGCSPKGTGSKAIEAEKKIDEEIKKIKDKANVYKKGLLY